MFVERKTHREGWKGEESVKDRITLQKDNIVGFLDGTYTLDMALRDAKVPALHLSYCDITMISRTYRYH